MKINAVAAYYSPLAANNKAKVTKTKPVESPTIESPNNIVVISFKGNPAKNPNQVAAYATESNFLGGIYMAGGLGDVAEALPESVGKHGKEVTGKDIDMRTFHPYYSFSDDEGRLYVATKEAVEKYKAGKAEELIRDRDFKLVDQNYKLQEGESFALITDARGQGGQQIKKMFLLKDTLLSGEVERLSKDSLEMEKVPYKILEVEMNASRNDRMYLIHTKPAAQGKSAYGFFHLYENASAGGSTAYGGSMAYGGSRAYGGSTAYGGAQLGSAAQKESKFFVGRASGDMFTTEQIRAMNDAMEKMGTSSSDKFNPQNILIHDRFGNVMFSDMVSKMKTNPYYQGLKAVSILHNPGRTYQGTYENPIDFFRIVATKSDLDNLKASPHFNLVKEIESKIAKGSATVEECTQLYNFFKPYFPNYVDAEGAFNMTKIAVSTTNEYPENCNIGNVSRYFGKESRDFATEDIAKGLTQDLINIKDKTIDVVNGVKPANMQTDNPTGFFGRGEIGKIFADQKDPRKYIPYKSTDSVETVYKAKLTNKKNLINMVADATDKAKSDPDALIKAFLSEPEIQNNRGADKDLKLTLGGLSHFQEGDKLILSWGRPDPQKGLKVTARAFRYFLEDESIPLERRAHTKLLFGAGKDVFRDGNPEWEGIKEELAKISEIEVNGKKGYFSGNACYVNSLFPNRFANCADVTNFTSRWEPCGITPFESMAAGTPVINIHSGGAPDFITPGKTGILTKDPFMLSHKALGISENVSAAELDEARCMHAAKDDAQALKEYINHAETDFVQKQKDYISNCFNEKIEWHNNSKYNGGKSALEIYLKDKFRTNDNNVPTDFKSNGRGLFDETAFKSHVKSEGLKGKNKKVALLALGAAAIAGLGVAGYKAGWFSSKFAEEKDHGKMSRIG